MKPELEPFLEQLADPEQPWVWVPTDTPPDFWDDLSAQAQRRGFRVIDLDRSHDIHDQAALLNSFPEPSANMNALKDDLCGLPRQRSGYTVLLRNPEPLCDNDPETFEDLLDIVEVVNEARLAASLGPFTLVTLDADEPLD
jgi:hypothetical protein